MGRLYYEEKLPHAIEVKYLRELETASVKEEKDNYKIRIHYPESFKREPRNFWLSYTVLDQWEPEESSLEWLDPGCDSIEGKVILELQFPYIYSILQARCRLNIDGKTTLIKGLIDENTVRSEFECEKYYEDCTWEIKLKKRENPLYTENELVTLDPRHFEELIVFLLISLGYRKVTLTPFTGDKGRDILCELPTKFGNALRGVVECKRTKKIIGAPDVRRLAGAVVKEEVDFGIFITTTGFSLPAYKEFAINRLNGPLIIELVDRYELFDLLDDNGFIRSN